MAKVIVEQSTLTNIANALREKLGTNETFRLSEMATAVSDIEAGVAETPITAPTSDRDYLYFQAEENGACVSMEMHLGWSYEFQYSTDGTSWNDWGYTSGINKVFNKITLAHRGDYVFIRSKNTFNPTCSNSNYLHFILGAKRTKCGGNVMSLLKSDLSVTALVSNYQFYNLFGGCTYMTSAPKLPSTTLRSCCYQYMFNGCSMLKEAPNLPATTAQTYCYANMFQNCASLTTAPTIALTSTADYCCSYMFNGCLSLVNAPALNSMTVGYNCYEYMFQNCYSLEVAPSLPATTVNPYCYQYMFNNCRLLTVAPNLPATTLKEYCYRYMFYNCVSLANPPEMKATTLYSYCCDYMFAYCSSLRESPELLSQNRVGNEYRYMFYKCSSLQKVTCHLLAYNVNSTNDWMNGVPASGIFIKNALNGSWSRNSSGIPTGWTVVDYIDYFYVENKYAGTNTLTIEVNGTPDTSDLAYSTDKVNWTQVNLLQHTTQVQVPQNGKVYMRSSTGLSKSEDDYVRINMQENFSTGGNIMTLIDYNNSGTQSAMTPYGFTKLFENANMTSVCALPAKTLASYCYHRMFDGCSITTPPALPATTLAEGCYSSMFVNSHITSAPTLSATAMTADCYRAMFYNCASLNTPPALPATTLAARCYMDMFGNTPITGAPSLPVTTMMEDCYKQMFANCSMLGAVPDLPGQILAVGCYENMFQNCVRITNSGSLKAAVLVERCYKGMFGGCSNLVKITCTANSRGDISCTEGWTYGVAPTGVFLCTDEELFQRDSADGIPFGWTVEEIEPICISAVDETESWTFSWIVGIGSYDGWGSGGYDPEMGGDYYYYDEYSILSDALYGSIYNIEYSKDGVNWVKIVDETSMRNDPTEYYNSHSMYLQRLHTVTSDYGWENRYKIRVGVYASISMNPGERIFLRGNLTNFKSFGEIEMDNGEKYLYTYNPIKVDVPYRCYGDLTSIFNGVGGDFEFTSEISLAGFFENDHNIVKAPNLPSTKLSNYSVYGVGQIINFDGEYIYDETYTVGIYENMFRYCENLVESMKSLPATEAKMFCYRNMFCSCTSLVTAPKIEATAMEPQSFYQMFYYCPQLNGMYDDMGMPASCMTLFVTNISYYGFYKMFSYCGNVQHIKVYATSWNTSNASNWVNMVNSTGTFEKPSGTTIPTGVSGIPSGWTVINF